MDVENADTTVHGPGGEVNPCLLRSADGATQRPRPVAVTPLPDFAEKCFPFFRPRYRRSLVVLTRPRFIELSAFSAFAHGHHLGLSLCLPFTLAPTKFLPNSFFPSFFFFVVLGIRVGPRCRVSALYLL